VTADTNGPRNTLKNTRKASARSNSDPIPDHQGSCDFGRDLTRADYDDILKNSQSDCPVVGAMEFFRHCPNCGLRFHIKLETKKLVDVKRETLQQNEVVRMGGGTGAIMSAMMPYLKVREGPPAIIDHDEFRYAYLCTHCGHEWSEKHVEDHPET